MLARRRSKIMIFFTTFASVMSVVGICLNDPKFYLPSPLASTLRVIVMTQAGIFLGLLFACLTFSMKLKVDPSDRFLRPIGMVLSCSILLALYSILNLSEILMRASLTWRTPVLFIAFSLGDWGLFLLFKRLKEVTKIANSRQALIKLTFIDTHTPGPDVDISSGTPVV